MGFSSMNLPFQNLMLQKAIPDTKKGKAVTQKIDGKLYLIYRFDIKTKPTKTPVRQCPL